LVPRGITWHAVVVSEHAAEQYPGDIKSVLLSSEAIQTKVAELGATIGEDYRETIDSAGQDLLLVTVLKGDMREPRDAPVRAQRQVDDERAECHAGQHPKPIHQDAGQRYAACGIQRGRMADGNGQPQRGPPDHCIGQRSANEGQDPLRPWAGRL